MLGFQDIKIELYFYHKHIQFKLKNHINIFTEKRYKNAALCFDTVQSALKSNTCFRAFKKRSYLKALMDHIAKYFEKKVEEEGQSEL